MKLHMSDNVKKVRTKNNLLTEDKINYCVTINKTDKANLFPTHYRSLNVRCEF